MRSAFSSAPWLGAFPLLELLALTLSIQQTRCDGPNRVLDDALTFVTRPDIEAPRFDIKVYDESLVSPGYWFIESYDYLDQSRANGGHWTAPHIYDSSGGLIWSGAYLSEQYNSFDFRISSILGEDMITWYYPRNRSGIIMDTHYNVRRKFQISDRETQPDDMHDLNFVDGSRVLYFYDDVKNLTASQSMDVGLSQGGICPVRDISFDERDVETDEILFSWSSSEHVDLKESTFTDPSIEERCGKEHGWDFMHANSVDKFADGSGYLMSGRHTDTIYKINPDKTIAWQLGGLNNDFEKDFTFSRQHHARVLDHNSTHTTMSIFDNAMGEDSQLASVSYSRGLIVLLQTDIIPMKATMITEYPHPDGEHVPGRGSAQILSNGNAFMCWVNACLVSEHTADGTLIMEARVAQKWLKTYRAYKFDFVGLPDLPPDIHSETTHSDNETNTVIHASWNGATEVASWKFYKTDPTGKYRELLNVVPRESFETMLSHQEYAKYVIVEALDRNNELLGQSHVLETIISSHLPDDVVSDEEQWLAGQTAALQTAAVQSTTVKIATLQTATVQTATLQTTPVETVPVETTSVETTSLEATPTMHDWRGRVKHYAGNQYALAAFCVSFIICVFFTGRAIQRVRRSGMQQLSRIELPYKSW